MHEYFALKELLMPTIKRSGYQQSDEQTHPDVYGSAYSAFDKDSRTIRLIWDGKDGAGYVQIRQDDEWKDLPVYVRESNDKDFKASAHELCRVLEELLDNDTSAA